MHLRFPYVFSWFDSSLLFTDEYHSIVWMDHSIFTHSPAEGHLGCFQVLIVMNKAFLDIYVQVFV